jgi:hypothetical protein
LFLLFPDLYSLTPTPYSLRFPSIYVSQRTRFVLKIVYEISAADPVTGAALHLDVLT